MKINKTITVDGYKYKVTKGTKEEVHRVLEPFTRSRKKVSAPEKREVSESQKEYTVKELIGLLKTAQASEKAKRKAKK